MLFVVVVRTLALAQKLESHEIGNLVDYDLPVSRLVAEFDIYTDRYEPGILRALRPDTNDPNEIRAASSASQSGRLRSLTTEPQPYNLILGSRTGRFGRSGLAKSEKRGPGRVTRRKSWGSSSVFDDAISEFAAEYANQNERDYRAFIKAIRAGRLKAITEI